MARSNREYGDPTPKTLANAIAYVHASQQTTGLHMSTRSRVMDLYEFRTDRGGHNYHFSPEALELAKDAPMMKAFEWCKANGFSRRQYGRHSLRGVEMWNPHADQIAHIDKYGNVHIVPETGSWRGKTKWFNPSKGEVA